MLLNILPLVVLLLTPASDPPLDDCEASLLDDDGRLLDIGWTSLPNDRGGQLLDDGGVSLLDDGGTLLLDDGGISLLDEWLLDDLGRSSKSSFCNSDPSVLILLISFKF